MVTVNAIHTEQDYKAALKRLNEIFDAQPGAAQPGAAQPGSAEGEEAEVLVLLIEKYEAENFPVEYPDPIEAIKIRMEDLGLHDKDLVEAMGNKSSVSLVLNRKRPLTLQMIRNLSELLGLSVELLIQPYELNTDKLQHA
jgi:HTH-type transcriptional regulator/antitoxin HigA